MSSFFSRGVCITAIGVAALAAWPPAGRVAERTQRTEDVTIRILASAHDRGEIKPCG